MPCHDQHRTTSHWRKYSLLSNHHSLAYLACVNLRGFIQNATPVLWCGIKKFDREALFSVSLPNRKDWHTQTLNADLIGSFLSLSLCKRTHFKFPSRPPLLQLSSPSSRVPFSVPSSSSTPGSVPISGPVTSPTISKWKRSARLIIPVTVLSFAVLVTRVTAVRTLMVRERDRFDVQRATRRNCVMPPLPRNTLYNIVEGYGSAILPLLRQEKKKRNKGIS